MLKLVMTSDELSVNIDEYVLADRLISLTFMLALICSHIITYVISLVLIRIHNVFIKIITIPCNLVMMLKA